MVDLLPYLLGSKYHHTPAGVMVQHQQQGLIITQNREVKK